MKVIICGAGQVGYGIAEQLSREDNEVSVIDSAAPIITAITETLALTGPSGSGKSSLLMLMGGLDRATGGKPAWLGRVDGHAGWANSAALRAVADDHQAAQSIGIPLSRIWVIVWSVAGCVALVVGIIWGSKLGVQYSLSLVALKALPVVILVLGLLKWDRFAVVMRSATQQARALD